MQVIRGFVSKETVVLRRWGLETIVWFYQGFGFLRGASLYKAFFENPLRGGGGVLETSVLKLCLPSIVARD